MQNNMENNTIDLECLENLVEAQENVKIPSTNNIIRESEEIPPKTPDSIHMFRQQERK